MMSDAKAYGKYVDEVLSQKTPCSSTDTIRAIEHRGDFRIPFTWVSSHATFL
ncbi:MAG: hypothetical protein IPI30_04405 [Saprospiraceae bacterium]|nr:hypothetical protein [Candidatus Vicinibacter affinis]